MAARNRTLRYAVVRMPFDGVVWRTNVVEGSNVIAGAELAHHVRPMLLHRAPADAEALCNGGARLAARHKFEHLFLTRRQGVETIGRSSLDLA